MLLSEDKHFCLAHKSVLVRRQLRSLLSRLDTVIFDIDGVLIDTRGSFSEAVCEAIQFYFEHVLHIQGGVQLLYPDEVHLFKMAGGFNSDRDLAEGALLFFLWKMLRFGLDTLGEVHSQQPSVREFTQQIASRGGGLGNIYRFTQQHSTPQMREKLNSLFDSQLVRRLFLESYSGRHCRRIYGFEPRFFAGEGKIKKEKVILKTALLKKQMVNQNLSCGILSGRTPGEVEMALEMLSLRDSIPEKAIVADDGRSPTKPDPTGLIELCNTLQTKIGLYVGDTIDDLRLVSNFRVRQKMGSRSLPQMEFCLCLTDHLDEETVRVFRFQGAALIAKDVNAFLEYLDSKGHKDG
ncbi:MAG: HAD family hydrolase [Candidatus Latescibacteria bacterium]|nr:HAD family hydrolase [Candidatus Latescibacterota bacterium]